MKLALILFSQLALWTTFAAAQTSTNNPDFTCKEVGEPSSRYNELSVYRESMDNHYRAVYVVKLKIKGTEQTKLKYFDVNDDMDFFNQIKSRHFFTNLQDKAGRDGKVIGELQLAPNNPDFDLSIIYQTTPYGGANTDYFKCQFKY